MIIKIPSAGQYDYLEMTEMSIFLDLFVTPNIHNQMRLKWIDDGLAEYHIIDVTKK